MGRCGSLSLMRGDRWSIGWNNLSGPSLHPAFYPKNHGADNAEVSGSTPRRIAGKPNVQPPQTGLIEQHLQLKTSCNSLSGLDLSLPPVKYLHVSLYPFLPVWLLNSAFSSGIMDLNGSWTKKTKAARIPHYFATSTKSIFGYCFERNVLAEEQKPLYTEARRRFTHIFYRFFSLWLFAQRAASI